MPGTRTPPARPLLLAALLLPLPAHAATLVVGEGGTHPTLPAAAAAARDGDTIRILPGERFECAIIGRRNLTIEGEGAVLTDATCAGKAILVLQGDNTLIRCLTLARARSPDLNGAGIRLEAQGLRIDGVRFLNDQVGILGGPEGPGEVRIENATFEGGGLAGDRPAAAVNLGPIGRLFIRNSTFRGIKGGQITSAATVTEIVGNTIETGVEPGAGPAILATGDRLAMQGNTLRLGPEAPPRDAAVVAMTPVTELRDNRLDNATGRPMTLLLDWTAGTPVLQGNVVAPSDTLVSSRGYLRHRMSGMARAAYGEARRTAGAARRTLSGWLH